MTQSQQHGQVKDFEAVDSFTALDLTNISSLECIGNKFISRFISKRLNTIQSFGSLLKCEYETAPERTEVLSSNIRNILAAKNTCKVNIVRVPKSLPHKIIKPPEESMKMHRESLKS